MEIYLFVKQLYPVSLILNNNDRTIILPLTFLGRPPPSPLDPESKQINATSVENVRLLVWETVTSRTKWSWFQKTWVQPHQVPVQRTPGTSEHPDASVFHAITSCSSEAINWVFF